MNGVSRLPVRSSAPCPTTALLTNRKRARTALSLLRSEDGVCTSGESSLRRMEACGSAWFGSRTGEGSARTIR